MARPKKNDKNTAAPKQEDTNIQRAAEVLRSSDFLSNLDKSLSDAGVSTPAPEPKKNDRWELVLDQQTLAVAESFVGASTVLKSVEHRVDNTKAQIVSYCSKEIMKKIWENKSKPSNPEIILRDSNNTPDHRFIFMCQDRFKVEHDEIPEKTDVKEFFAKIFVKVGLNETNAKNLVENELNFNPVTGIRSLTELLDGYYGAGREWIESSSEEKSAGMKLAKLLMWDGSGPVEPLTPAEKSIVVSRKPNVVVKAEFFNRVALYCENLEQLEAVLSVIKPIYSVGHIKFAMNSSEKDRINRMIGAASEILGEKE